MPLEINLPARLKSALPAHRGRRVLGWLAAVVFFGAAAVPLFAYTAAGVAPSPGTRALMGAAGLASGVLMYFLAAPRRDGLEATVDAVGILWRRLIVVLGLLVAIEAAPLLFGLGAANVRRMPADLLSASGAVFYTALHLLVAVYLLRGLRPLVLSRPTRASLATWRLFMAATLVASVARLLTPPDAAPSFLHFLAAASVAILMAAAAFRQQWILPLPTGPRLRAGGLSLLLAVVMGLAMGESFSGPGSVEIEGLGLRGGDREDIPYTFLLSPGVGDLVAIPMAFALLYGVTSALTLLFSLPATGAYAQRAGEVRAFRTLSALTLDPAQGLDRERLAATVARAPVEAGIARAAWVALSDASRGTLAPAVVAADGLSVEAASRSADAAALAGEALDRRRPLVLARAAADHRVYARPGDGVGSLLVLPLAAGGQDHGALFAARATPDAFDPDETAALEAFAGQAALALSHASLFTEAIERERLARELALARDVQRRLVPEELPEVPGALLAGGMRSAQEVCGDYYDVAELPDGRVGLLVADVAGKGAVAAFHMAQLKGIFQASASLSPSPGRFLARANEALRPSLGPRSFVSAVYAVLDPAEGTLTMARAGHCPAILVRNGAAWPLRAPGLGLGLDAGPLFKRTLVEQIVALRPGDVVALYSDGLVEARNADGVEFGYDRLNQAIVSAAAAAGENAAGDVRDALLIALDEFADPATVADDTTLLVLTWHGDVPQQDAEAETSPFALRAAFPEHAPSPATIS